MSDDPGTNSTTVDTPAVVNSPPANTPPATQPAQQAQPDLSQLLTAIAAMPESIAKSVAEAVKPPKTPSTEKPADTTKTTETKPTETKPVDNKTGPNDVGNSSMSFGDKFRKWWSEG